VNHFRIEIKETLISTYEIRASNEDDAIDFIKSNLDIKSIDEYVIEQEVLDVENLGEEMW